MHVIKKIKNLADKLENFSLKKKKAIVKIFTGIEIMSGKSIRAKAYKKKMNLIKLETTEKLNFKYPE